MKIVNLGTSHGDATITRFQSSTLLEAEGRYYLIDAGEPVSASLIRRGIKPAQITAVFITHMHCDHAGGLPLLSEQADKYRRLHPSIHLRILVPDEEAIPAFLAWEKVCRIGKTTDPARISAYSPGKGYDDGILSMTAIPNRHLLPIGGEAYHSNALRIEAEGRNILFTGDLSSDFSDFPSAAANGCDLVYSELTHYPLEKALPILKQCSFGKLIFYHLHNPYQTRDGAEAVLRRCREYGLPFPVEMAFDGMETVLPPR